METTAPYAIQVLGAFDLRDAGGRSIRPAGRKDCAVLAMLALAREHRQTRSWLQEKLWGDRGPAQAAASLRQSLTVLRGLLGDRRDAIGADRTWVWLDPAAFRFDHLAPGAAGEVLRGLDLAEEGFEDWLREARAAVDVRPGRLAAAPAAAEEVERRWHVEAPSHAPGDERAAEFGRLVVDGLLESAATIGLGTVTDRRAAVDPPPVRATDLVVRAKVAGFGADAVVSVAATDGMGTLRWQVRREVAFGAWASVRAAQVDVAQQFQDFAIRAEAERLRGARWSAHANGCQALLGVLMPGAFPVPEILRCCLGAIAARDHGIHHALLGHARLRIFGERESLTVPDVDEVMGSVRTAVRLSPGNGLVQALAGHAYGFYARDPERNVAMTREAVRLQPNSGPCWIYRTISLVYTGRMAEAVGAAGTAVALCRGTMAHSFARSSQLYARLMAGDVRGAIRSGEEAVDGLSYRPAIVNLMTTYGLAGETEKGREKLRTLMAREPDLSVDLLRSPDYPIINPVHRGYVVEAAGRLGLH